MSSPNYAPLIGGNIRRRRQQLCYSQQRLAQLLGAHRQQIVSWENARHVPSVTHLHDLADALDVTVAYFWTDPG